MILKPVYRREKRGKKVGRTQEEAKMGVGSEEQKEEEGRRREGMKEERKS